MSTPASGRVLTDDAASHDPPLLVGPRLSLMMFLQFFVWGAWYVTVGNYMGSRGLGESIGHAYTVGPIAAVLSPLFLGMVADRYFSSERVLGVMHLLGGAALLAAPAAAKWSAALAAAAPPGATTSAEGGDAPLLNPAHLPFLLTLLVHMLCYMPTLGLTNTIAFHAMRRPDREFPLVRVFGTIGWIAAGWVFGLAAPRLLPAGVDATDAAAVDRAVKALPHFFYLAGGVGVALGLYAFTLPRTPPPAAGARTSVRDALGLEALGLLRRPSFMVFAVCSFLICIPLAGYYAFAPVFVGQAGIRAEDVPKVMSYGQMSEIGFMLVLPLALARLGVKWVLAAGMLAWIARYGLFSAAATDRVAWMVLAGVTLHGICYDFFFVTGFIYVDREAPRPMRARAQGFLVLITQGLGLGIGAQLMGLLTARFSTGPADARVFDWERIWLWPCLFAAAVLAVFVVAFRDTSAPAPAPSGDPGGAISAAPTPPRRSGVESGHGGHERGGAGGGRGAGA
jgi:nucleoside transporter